MFLSLFMKTMSENNLKPKNQFQRTNPTGAQNLTLWPLLFRKIGILNLKPHLVYSLYGDVSGVPSVYNVKINFWN